MRRTPLTSEEVDDLMATLRRQAAADRNRAESLPVDLPHREGYKGRLLALSVRLFALATKIDAADEVVLERDEPDDHAARGGEVSDAAP